MKSTFTLTSVKFMRAKAHVIVVRYPLFVNRYPLIVGVGKSVLRVERITDNG